MNILLTNDDGYAAAGIQALRAALAAEHRVYLCAPLGQKSAVSHGINLERPLELREIPDGFAVDGTPADCVKAALFGLFTDVAFDLLISGVNDGANMGDDVFYSGTVAGAREGSLNGLFSIACSLNGRGADRNFRHAAEYVRALIDRLTHEILAESVILNINMPEKTPDRGTRVTRLGKRVYRDIITIAARENKRYLTISGELPGDSDQDGSDLNAVREGYVSVTPLTNEYAPSRILRRIEALF